MKIKCIKPNRFSKNQKSERTGQLNDIPKKTGKTTVIMCIVTKNMKSYQSFISPRFCNGFLTVPNLQMESIQIIVCSILCNLYNELFPPKYLINTNYMGYMKCIDLFVVLAV